MTKKVAAKKLRTKNLKKPNLLRRIAKKSPYTARFFEWKDSQRLWRRVLIDCFLILLVLTAAHNVLESSFRPVKHPVYGVSFSAKYSEELGLDWRENYQAVINDLGVSKLRLMSYWDISEPEKGKYNFADLDWQMDQAAQHNIKVSLSIGLRQPRWPECHQPNWARDLGNNTRRWQDALNNYIVTVENRYKNHPALESYQLENEAQNNWFGECAGAALRDRLIEEYDLAKKTDPIHPVFMSLSDEHGYPLNGPVPDEYGFSVYRIVWNDKTPIPFYLIYPTPIWYHRLRLWAIETFKHRTVFIHELQLEPWGPVATRELSIEEQDKSMSVKQMRKNLDFGRKIGAKEIYGWGSEWWYWRKVKFGDNGPWQTAINEFRKK